MALEMKVFKEIGSYEPKPMFGLTWRQLAAVTVMGTLGGGLFAAGTMWALAAGADTSTATSAAMWLIWPVLLPAAVWGWWRPQGLKPEKFLSFALREAVMVKEVVYGRAAEPGRARAGRGRAIEADRGRKITARRKAAAERE